MTACIVARIQRNMFQFAFLIGGLVLLLLTFQPSPLPAANASNLPEATQVFGIPAEPDPIYLPFISNARVGSIKPTGRSALLADINETAIGDGFIRFDGANYTRNTTSPNVSEGYQNGSVYRSFVEWDTSSLPSDMNIRAVGLALMAKGGYGKGNTISMVRMTQPLASYPNTQAGNQQLFNDIGTNPVYLPGDSAGTSLPGSHIFNLEYDSGPKVGIIADLQHTI